MKLKRGMIVKVVRKKEIQGAEIGDKGIVMDKDIWICNKDGIYYNTSEYGLTNITPKIGNKIFKFMNKRSFLIPNETWLRKLVSFFFRIRSVRGRGSRKKIKMLYPDFRFNSHMDIPLKYAEKVRVYVDLY
jgi:hypothetical protein